MKVNIAFVMEAKNTFHECVPEQTLSKIIFVNKMFYSVENKDDLRVLEEQVELKSKVMQVRSEKKLGKQGSHYDIQELFEPITKSVSKTEKNHLKNLKLQLQQLRLLSKIFLVLVML